MIERVVLHQSRFRTPGLVPDARGVALGPLGLVLLSSPERLVSFLRAAGEEGALDELLDSLRIMQVVSPLRTREMIVEVQASSSHRMDRLSAISRLLGGMVFTGSGRHFVKYRDAQAPFGYDIGELLAEPGDLALYHDRFAQPYKSVRTIPDSRPDPAALADRGPEGACRVTAAALRPGAYRPRRECRELSRALGRERSRGASRVGTRRHERGDRTRAASAARNARAAVCTIAALAAFEGSTLRSRWRANRCSNLATAIPFRSRRAPRFFGSDGEIVLFSLGG